MLCVWFSAHCVGKVVLWCTLYSVWLCVLCNAHLGVWVCDVQCGECWEVAPWVVLVTDGKAGSAYHLHHTSSHTSPRSKPISALGIWAHLTEFSFSVLTGDQNVCQRKGRLLSFIHQLPSCQLLSGTKSLWWDSHWEMAEFFLAAHVCVWAGYLVVHSIGEIWCTRVWVVWCLV